MPGTTWKRVLAHEWLALLGSIAGTLLFVLGIGVLRDTLDSILSDLEALFAAIVYLGLALYGGILLVRSIVWAIRTLRKPMKSYSVPQVSNSGTSADDNR